MGKRDKLQPEELGIGLKGHFKPDISKSPEMDELLKRLGGNGMPLTLPDENLKYVEPRP